jgi:hypothetical protein
MYPKPIILLNRMGGIVAWVGIWNILDMLDHDSIIVNICYSVIGMIILTLSGEFDEPEKYVQIVESVEV